jgi:hypothetical protein
MIAALPAAEFAGFQRYCFRRLGGWLRQKDGMARCDTIVCYLSMQDI